MRFGVATKNIRDCIKTAMIAKSVEDIDWLAARFLKIDAE
jgi:hypothetical protein